MCSSWRLTGSLILFSESIDFNGKHLERMDLILLECQPERCNVRLNGCRLVERTPRDSVIHGTVRSSRDLAVGEGLSISSPTGGTWWFLLESLGWDSEADWRGTRIGRFGSVAVSITLFLFFFFFSFPTCDVRIMRAGRLDHSNWIWRENNRGLGQGFSGIFFGVERLPATPQFF